MNVCNPIAAQAAQAGTIPSEADPEVPFRCHPTRRGLRFLQHGVVISEMLRQPGPTHSVADLLAAAVLASATGPRVALLGFAAGGIMAPLRALGWTTEVYAVDLNAALHHLFLNAARDWAGPVQFTQDDAAGWLRGHSRCFDVMVVDLSVSNRGDVQNPPCVWTELPGLMATRLSSGGCAVFNLLPGAGEDWNTVIGRILRPLGCPRAHVVLLDEFENRLLIADRRARAARTWSMELRRLLSAIGSRQARGFRVREFKSNRFARVEQAVNEPLTDATRRDGKSFRNLRLGKGSDPRLDAGKTPRSRRAR
jgi:hypothetical protein